MLVSALCVVVGRLLELIVLLARRDRTKELQILVLRHELYFEPQNRLLLATLSRVLPRNSWNAFSVAVALAPSGGGAPLDISAPAARASAVRA